jgi:hypothetical protein
MTAVACLAYPVDTKSTRHQPRVASAQ